MTKKWKVIDNNFSLYIEDTTQIEDKHEGNINNIYELCNQLNEYECEIKALKKLVGIMEDTDGRDVMRLVNDQQNKVENLAKKYESLKIEHRQHGRSNEKLLKENRELKKTLRLVSESDSVMEHDSVKEIVRDNIKGIDTVTYDSAMAWDDYCVLSKFFKEYYKEHWDND